LPRWSFRGAAPLALPPGRLPVLLGRGVGRTGVLVAVVVIDVPVDVCVLDPVQVPMLVGMVVRIVVVVGVVVGARLIHGRDFRGAALRTFRAWEWYG
jgi:hypothetical protein